ncbi:iron export ABC transporter permease subunit FetB [Advenella sp. WQ 585]|uniref:Iron export ABC transporter permease subunit FetB n=1 Tax=Advenella mandrilli TaxID=2800330 RepID=A0ABS1EHF3_9BURK|nr:iron export ABC transporter permease subunit FetB [Advenella mandrilli]MBK1782452.1 iron export ABC transporter permease subunit FetB [Advenella mandrilli]
MPSYIEISYLDIALASLLVLSNGLISILLKLKLEKSLLISAVRMVVQLLLIGFVLKWVFSVDQWYVVLFIIGIMTFIAGMAAYNRNRIQYGGMRIDALVSVWVSSWLVALLGLVVVLQVQPWYSPQYVIPIMGMILGNTLTGVSLGLDRITHELTQKREQVEMLLALGATRWEAFKEPAQNAVMAGMMPTINSMMVIGLVSLPGMMTGQILAGQDPEQAIRYQIIIMFFLSAASSMGCVLAVVFVFRRLFSTSHNFMYWKLQEK